MKIVKEIKVSYESLKQIEKSRRIDIKKTCIPKLTDSDFLFIFSDVPDLPKQQAFLFFKVDSYNEELGRLYLHNISCSYCFDTVIIDFI